MATPEVMRASFTALPGHLYHCEGDQDIRIAVATSHYNVGSSIRIEVDASFRAVVYLEASGNEVLDGAPRRVMKAGDKALLLGVMGGWCKIHGVSHPPHVRVDPAYLL